MQLLWTMAQTSESNDAGTARRFTKSGGLTPSEELLATLCERSFLSLWSYPNLYRKAGKELCDLLVVFGDDVILFSDKSCGFPASGDVELDWSRWYRRSVSGSAKQMRRAEEWVRRQPERIFLDPQGEVRLPVEIPPSSRLRIHRVCVALRRAGAGGNRTIKPHRVCFCGCRGGTVHDRAGR